MTKIYLGKPYRIRMYGGTGYAHRWQRVYRWCIDVMAEFRGWREQTRLGRLVSYPFASVRWWVKGLFLPHDIDGQNRRGVIDARKLGFDVDDND